MADTCIRCKGLLHFMVDGRMVRVQSDGDITILVSPFRRTETYAGEFTQEERNPTITATIVVPDDTLVSDIQELCNVRVTVQLCDERTFTALSASNVSDAPYDAKRNLQPIQLICAPPDVSAAGVGVGRAIVENLPRRTSTAVAAGPYTVAA